MRKGFTLIELLLVISIISLLSSIVISNSTESKEKARIAAGLKLENQIKNQYFSAGYWTFDNGNAVSNSGISLSNTGVTFPDGSFNNTKYAQVGPNSNLKLNNSEALSTDLHITKDTNMVLSAWFKISSGSGRLISFAQQGYVPGYFLGLADNNRVSFGVGGSTPVNAYAEQNYADNKWHHYAVFIDFKNDQIKVFFDGKQLENFGKWSGSCGSDGGAYFNINSCTTLTTENPKQFFCVGSIPVWSEGQDCNTGINAPIDNVGVFFEI